MVWAWLQTLGLPLWLPRCRRGLITAVISFGSFSTQCLMPKSPEVDNPNKSKQGNLLWCKDTNCLWAGVLQHVCSLWGFLDLNGAPVWQVCSQIDVLSHFRFGISWSLGLRLDSQPFWCGDRHTKQHSPEQIGIYIGYSEMSDVSGACAEASELIEIEMLYINIFIYLYIYIQNMVSLCKAVSCAISGWGQLQAQVWASAAEVRSSKFKRKIGAV